MVRAVTVLKNHGGMIQIIGGIDLPLFQIAHDFGLAVLVLTRNFFPIRFPGFQRSSALRSVLLAGLILTKENLDPC